MELTVVAEDATLARTIHVLRLLRRINLAHELWWVLSEAHEAAPVHLAGDSVSAHRLIPCNVFDGDILRTFLVEHRVVEEGRVVCGGVLRVGYDAGQQTSLIAVLAL